ncbi:glycerate kinase [Photobacterium sp. 1_MG-2023]|uniref:glycerate kinase type-2 family protein n=1 Tax=Photobacterium sp. 1_MG-2023 TaxID=3062646 RepID=UPI0026E148F6|nr:glycerate kinase [Photobacterium sp. 1_MG-2023]MDO6708956.1 glycerate kinase [Photobacterium sp. 1_MG-2023]
MHMETHAFLTALFNRAVQQALPGETLAQYLPEDKTGKAVVIGAGKAAASMANALEAVWEGELEGLVVTRYGHTAACQQIEVIEAAHPVPDDAGREVAERMLHLVQGLDENDLVICLLSGGGSALLSLPAPGITFAQKQQINKALLKSGAAIDEMNCVRKHLSAIKGGQLAKAVAPARLITLAISDVPGDEATVIASGPTVADPTTSQDALEILSRYQVSVPDSVTDWLHSPESETVKPGDPCLTRASFELIASPQLSLEAAADEARKWGIPAHILSDCIEGESRDVAKVHAALAKQVAEREQPFQAPCVLLSGGETTVTVRGEGRGGRNSEFLLSLYHELQGHSQIYALAADTDGIDGVEDNAGAVLNPQSYPQGLALELNSQDYLDNNDGYTFFKQLDSLLTTGPTLTNVNDFRAILILPKEA